MGATSDEPLPSPPLEEYPHNLQYLVQHNAAVPYRSIGHSMDAPGYNSPAYSTEYGSPAPNHWQPEQYSGEVQSLGVTHDVYGNPLYSQSQNYPYHTGTPPYTNGPRMASNPPTPAHSDDGNGFVRVTRGGRGKASGQNKWRPSPSARTKKTKPGKEKPKVPKLDEPLSTLTKEMTNVPVRDMEGWVNRSTEVRKQEVEKRNGYVTRPMNSFMLYRSAYAERTKLWCLQNNHQVVSSVSGESWPMEPSEVRERYNEYARIERDNHQKAHPGYKFSPSKSANSSRKRKGTTEASEEEDATDNDDADLEYRPPGGARRRGKSVKRQGRGAGYPVNSGLHAEIRYDVQAGIHPSSFYATNPNKALPQPLDMDMFGQYYETSMQPAYHPDHMIEDVHMKKMALPGAHGSMAPPLIALPGASHYELLDQHSVLSNPVQFHESQVDPALTAFGTAYANQAIAFADQGFDGYDDDALLNGTLPQRYAAGGVMADPSQWEEMAFKVENDDFAHFMREHNDR